MTDHEIERRIRTAVEHAAPDRLDQLLSSCGRQNRAGAGEEARISGAGEGEKPHRSGRANRYFGAVAAIAAVFVLCFCGYYLLQGGLSPQADAVVTLDVNPSLALSVDAEEKVLSVDAQNDEAREILGSMELEGTSLEVAVNALIGSMLQKGYLGDLQNAILVSVEGRDAARGQALQKKVTDAVTSAAQNGSLDAAVLSLQVSAGDAALAEMAQQYGISMGKAALIREVVGQVPTLSAADLAPMTINEIALIAASKHVSSESVAQSGAASDKAYIGQAEAVDLACAHAGVAREDILTMEVEFDSQDGTMVYEVEFETAGAENEYEINAATGEILKFESKGRGGAVGSGAAGAAGSGSYIGENAAKAAALAHAGVAEDSAAYISCYLEYEDGRPACYCVEFQADGSGYEYEIDLYSGAVLDCEIERRRGSGGGETGPAGASYIGQSAALTAALNHAGVAESSLTEQEVELDSDDRVMVYKVEFQTGGVEYEYEIDAATGAVLSAERS